MQFKKYFMEGVVLLSPNVYRDDRGYFLESHNHNKLKTILGREINFVQDNESESKKNVIRGLHFQKPPHAQSKLIRVIKGKILDVIVDIRPSSRTFGKHLAVELDDLAKNQLFISKGFAHGFKVLSESAIINYKVDNYYAPKFDSGIAYNDLDLEIDWRITDQGAIVSEKDKSLKSFKEYQKQPCFNLKTFE